MDQEKIRPRRTCLGCGAKDDQGRMIRIRAAVSGELIADKSGLGRGGYLHPTEDCWDRFSRRKSVHRAFHVEIAKRAREKLVEELRERYGE